MPFGKVADLPWIGDAHSNTCRVQRIDQHVLEATAPFADHQGLVSVLDLGDHLSLDRGHGVGNEGGQPGGRIVDIELLRPDVHANHASVHSFHCQVPS